MTRLSLSFVATFLVLATCAVSAPTNIQRDEGHSFGLAKALGGLEKLPEIMENLDPNAKPSASPKPPAEGAKKGENHGEAEKPSAAGQQEKKVAEGEEPTPTATEKKLYSGNFATPTATHTHHPSSQANALGAIPIVGGILGGTGGSL